MGDSFYKSNNAEVGKKGDFALHILLTNSMGS